MQSHRTIIDLRRGASGHFIGRSDNGGDVNNKCEVGASTRGSLVINRGSSAKSRCMKRDFRGNDEQSLDSWGIRGERYTQ